MTLMANAITDSSSAKKEGFKSPLLGQPFDEISPEISSSKKKLPTVTVTEGFFTPLNLNDIFSEIAKICPLTDCEMNDIITVVIDEQHVLGKYFRLMPDGTINKTSAVAVARGIACQFVVPDHDTLQEVLRIVSDNPHAAIINAGWKHAEIGEQFVFLSKRELLRMGRDPEAVTTSNAMTAFARLKDHANPSTWQLLDRDENQFTPEWAASQSFSEWRMNLDRILPGVAKVRMLRAYSSSARVLRADGSVVGCGNGHVWIKIMDAADAERTRTAILARALEHKLTWTKPHISKTTGQECGRGSATIVDPSVWTTGRLIFVGCPTCSTDLKITAQQFEQVRGDSDALDTSKSVISVLKTFRAAAKQGIPLRLSRHRTGFSSVIQNLHLGTEIELEDGIVKTVNNLMLNFTGKVRCQAPFRASSSMAAFFSINGNGEPFVFDSGTDTIHTLENRTIFRKEDKDRERLILEVKSRIGVLIGDDNVAPVLNEDVLRTAWDATFYLPTNSKIAVLNKNDELIYLPETDFKKFAFRRIFGNVLDNELLDEVIAEMKLPAKEEPLLRKNLEWIEHGPFIECIKLVKQAKSLDISVDIFAKNGSLVVADNVATIIFPHRRFQPKFKVESRIVSQVVEDYIQHFPEFPKLLDLILHARFATDRRHAFVWLHSPSSWGKGFLLEIFAQLGLVFEVSASEIEKALSGGPVGLSLTDTLRAWILFVDEFKAASSELKLLNKQISIAPKNQLRCSVQLYTKLFASAENVRSLVGDGVEEQFNNRFSYLSPSTRAEKLENRPLFVDLGKAIYLGAMVNFVSEHLNKGVDHLCAMGAIESSKTSDNYIETFQSERKLNMTFGNLDDTVDDIVTEIRHCLIEYAAWYKSGKSYENIPDVVQGIGQNLMNALKRTAIVGYVSEGERSKHRHHAILLGEPVQFIKKYLALSEDRSTVGKMQYKSDDIATKMHMRPEHYSGRVRIYESDGTLMANKRGIVVFINHKTDKSDIIFGE